MRRFLLDTMIFDRIAETEGAASLVAALTEGGKIQLVATHVQDDELARIKDADKRRLIAAIPREDVPTAGFVIGRSRLGRARLGENAPREAIRATNWSKYTNDALIAATALYENMTLVTDERRLLKRAPRELGIETWDWPHFHSYLKATVEEAAI